MAIAPWLDVAWQLYGEKEIPGAADNARIVSWSRRLGHSWVTNDEVPWCAAYVGHVLSAAGFRSSGSLLARSYLKWGQPLAIPEAQSRGAPKVRPGLALGSIAILSRGRNPSQGHVGFLLGLDAAKVTLLGGNQGNAVTVARYARSRLLGLRWPSQRAVPRTGMACPVFQAALQHVLAKEGGCVNDPADPGGYTCKGVTEENFRRWRRTKGASYGSLNGLSVTQVRAQMRSMTASEIKSFYYERYWLPASCQKLPHGLAFFQFDCAVNQGVGRARRFLQRALGVSVDGEIGPVTLSTAFKKEEEKSIKHYASIRTAHYRGLPHFWRFGKGWLARVDDTLRRARLMMALSKGDKKVSQIAAQTQEAGTQQTETQQTETQQTEAHRTGSGQKVTHAKRAVEPGTRSTARDRENSGAAIEEGSQAGGQLGAKWWAHSKTIWGALIAAAAVVVPVITPLFGIDVSADDVRAFGTRVDQLLQVLAGLTGTVLTVWGRLTASAELTTREVRVRV